MKEHISIPKVLLVISLFVVSSISNAQKSTGDAIASKQENNTPHGKLTGKVLDKNGEVLPGVTVKVKGTGQIAITDANGNYSFSKVAPNTTLIFSFVGMQTTEMQAGNQNVLNVTLSESSNVGLNEVVVVGYGTVTRSNLTTSISSVNPSDVPNAANSSINQLLFGRAAGLQATQASAEPGGLVNLSVRGSGDPLVVVDGVVMPTNSLESSNSGIGQVNVSRGGIGNINPSDIESVEILKDASASIYGVAAANGVILITTKSGKQGKPKVTYDGSYSVIKNMPYMEAMSPAQYMTAFNEYAKDYYLSNNSMAPFGANTATGYTPYFSDSDISNAGSGTDWIGAVTRDGSINNHNVNISGATDKVKYYFSGSVYDQIGTVKQSDFKRYMGTMNLTFDFNKYLSFSSFVTASRSNYSNGQTGTQNSGSGSQNYGALQAAISYPTYLSIKDANGDYTLSGTAGNPVSLLSIQDKSFNSSVFSTFSLNVNIIPKMLTAKILYGNNYETSGRNEYIPSGIFFAQLYQSRGTITNDKRQNQTFEATVAFNKKLNIIDFDAVAGLGEYHTDGDGSGMYAMGMLDAAQTYNMGSAPTMQQMTSYKYFEKRRSYFTRLNFNALDKYLLSLSYRLDGIDKFFTGNKYAGFPSASLGWKINKEDFLSNFSNIDLLKIRASAGITGMAIGSVAYGQYSASGLFYLNQGGTTYTPYYLSSIDQPELAWQKTLNTNIGLDFGFFNSRISGAVDVFRNEITNLLTTRATDQLAMLPTAYENGGKCVNSGYELSLKTVNIAAKAFQWNTIINVSHYYNAWKERFANASLSKYIGVTDGVTDVYVYPTDGILQVGETPSAWQPAKASVPGCPKFVDGNGDGVLDYKDVKKYRGTPNVVLGFGNDFIYKNFDFSVFLYAQLGAWGFNNSFGWANARTFAGGNANGAVAEVLKAWSTVNTSGTLPGAAYSETTLGLDARSDIGLESKDFLRCRNITLGYTFNQPFVKKYVDHLRLYVDVQNPFIITNYSIVDPEVNDPSVKGASAPYPMARTFSLGVNVPF
jgi:Outer membrane cobalamin receptor protein